MTRLIIPQVGERWSNRDCRRDALVVAIRHSGDREDGWQSEIDFRYVAGVGGSNLWKRGVTPTQTVDLVDWNRLFRRAAVVAIVAIALAAGGCSNDASAPDPHAVVSCSWPDGPNDAAWTGECDLACADRTFAEANVGPLCDAVILGTCHSFDWMGTAGCCYFDSHYGTRPYRAVFAECR